MAPAPAPALVPATVAGIRRDGDGWAIDLATAEGAETVRARVIVDAGGRNAPVVARLGARRRRTDRLVCGWAGRARPPPARAGGHLPGGGADYQRMVAAAWRRYQAELADCYRAVTRWPRSPFWSRRTTGTTS